MEWLAVTGSLVGVLTFVFSSFHYVVLKPLKEAIVALKDIVNKLQTTIDEERRKRHEHDIKINTLEQEMQYFKEKLEVVYGLCLKREGG